MLDLLTLSIGAGAGAVIAQGLSRLREHRTSPTGLADLLNWGFVVDDQAPAIVLQKDGSLLAGWRYRGPDMSAATVEEVDALSAHVNDALLPFTDNWMFHVDSIRRPAPAYPPSRFPDPVCQLIDDERREMHETLHHRTGGQFETTYTLVATYLPPADAVARVAAFFVQGPRGKGADSDVQAWDRLLGRFRAALGNLESRLSPLLCF